MNIALVVYAYYSQDARVKKYAELLAHNGFKVDCICLKEDYSSKEKNISFIHFPLSRKRLGKPWYFVEYLLFFMFTSWILFKSSLSKNYQLIHVNNIPDFLIFTALTPKMFGAKLILDMHDPMPELYMDKYAKVENNFFVKILKFIEWISLHFADHILTANETFKEIFSRRAGIKKEKIDVILNCPDPVIFKPMKLTSGISKEFTLFYMGTVEKRFSLEVAIDSVPVLIQHIPKLRLIIVPKLKDEGAYLQHLIKKIKDNKLSKHVRVEQPKTNEQIARMLRTVDIGLALYEHSPYTESLLSVKLFEYVQMKIPVVTTKTKAISEYFTNKQLYFLSDNTQKEFQEAILTLFHNPALRKSLMHNAQEYLKKYNWEGEKQKYLDIIHSMTKMHE